MKNPLVKKRTAYSLAVGSLTLHYCELVASGKQEEAEAVGKEIDKICLEWLEELKAYVGKQGN